MPSIDATDADVDVGATRLLTMDQCPKLSPALRDPFASSRVRVCDAAMVPSPRARVRIPSHRGLFGSLVSDAHLVTEGKS